MKWVLTRKRTLADFKSVLILKEMNLPVLAESLREAQKEPTKMELLNQSPSYARKASGKTRFFMKMGGEAREAILISDKANFKTKAI